MRERDESPGGLSRLVRSGRIRRMEETPPSTWKRKLAPELRFSSGFHYCAPMLLLPLGNEAHTVGELAKIGGPGVGIGALLGAAGAGFNASESERSDSIRNGFLGGGVVGFLLSVGGVFAGIF